MRRFSAGLALLVSLSPLTGCGGEKRSPYELIVNSADATTEAETMGIAAKVKVEGAGTGMTIEMEGAMATDASRAEFEMDMDALGIPGDTKIPARIVDRVLYIDMGPLVDEMGDDAGLPDGVRWVSMDLDDVMRMAGVDASQLNSNDFSQYGNALQSLRGASEHVEELGKEKVRGEETTRYAVEVDLDKALKTVPEEMRDTVEKTFDAMGGESMDMEVWIDDDDRIRRMAYEMDMDTDALAESAGSSTGGDAGEMHMEYEMEYFDFGVGIDVEKPPADETRDFMELMAMEQVS